MSAEPLGFVASIGSHVGILGMLCSFSYRRSTSGRLLRLVCCIVETMLDPAGSVAEAELEDDRRRRLAAFYRERAPQLSRYLRARLRDSEGDDLVQDAFARLARRGSLVALQNPEAYLKRIVRNLLIDRKRRAGGRPTLLPLEDHEPQVRPDQADGIELAQLQEQYRSVVSQLPPRTRQVFLLHRVDGRTMKDIASELGISTRTAEWHVAQAILRLGEALNRR